MNEEQIYVVKNTWAAVVPIADTAADLFYNRLFELDSSLRELFPEDLSEQKEKLMQTLGTVIHTLERLENVLPAVRALGARHVGYGVRDDHYATVGAALLWTLEQGLGDEWSEEVRDAWSAAYGTLSQVMIRAGHEAATAAE